MQGESESSNPPASKTPARPVALKPVVRSLGKPVTAKPVVVQKTPMSKPAPVSKPASLSKPTSAGSKPVSSVPAKSVSSVPAKPVARPVVVKPAAPRPPTRPAPQVEPEPLDELASLEELSELEPVDEVQELEPLDEYDLPPEPTSPPTLAPPTLPKSIPYARPPSIGSWSSGSHLRRKGKRLLTPRDVTLPPICIKCGGDEDLKEKKLAIYYYPPFAFLALGALGAMLLRKKVTVRCSICRRDRARRLYFSLGGAGGLLLGFVLMFVGFDSRIAALQVFSILLILAALVILYIFSQTLSVPRLNGETAEIRGFGEKFLSQFRSA